MPVVTNGIEVEYGRIITSLAVVLGSPAAKSWEVPLFWNNPPQVVSRVGRQWIYDCHPVPNRHNPGRYLLARSERDGQRAVVRINTEAGDFSGASGAVVALRGNVTQVGYGFRQNKMDVRSIDVLLDVHPGAEIRIIPGGVNGNLRLNYLLRNEEGRITLVEDKAVEEDRKPAVFLQQPAQSARVVSTVTATASASARSAEIVPEIGLEEELSKLGRRRVSDYYARYGGVQKPALAAQAPQIS